MLYPIHFKVDSARAYPDKDSIRVGDTLWIEINFPTQLQDIATNKMIDYSNAGNLGEDISILVFTGGDVNNPGTSNANNNFNYFVSKGTTSSSVNSVRNFLFAESNGMYWLKVAIIPIKVGIYGLGIGDPSGVYRRNDVCTKAAFNISFSNTNQHLYYYQINRPGYSISHFEQQHLYCFKVY